MESIEENEISMIITEDGQYNLMDVDQQSVSELTDGTEVILQQTEGGVEVLYIVQQPEGGEGGMTYTMEGMVGADGAVSLVDMNGTIIQTSQTEVVTSNIITDTQPGNTVVQIMASETDETVVDMPNEAGDRIIHDGNELVDGSIDGKGDGIIAEEEEEISILLFCQYCGENLLTLEDLNTHLKEEHDVDADDETEQDDGEEITSLFPSCSTCRSTFLDEEDLKDHRKKCCPNENIAIVAAPSTVEDILSVKKEMPGLGEHKCQMCAKVFKVRSDLDIHNEEGHHDPFVGPNKNRKGGVVSMYHKCPYCPKMYMSKWHKKSLIKHIKVEHPTESWDVPFELIDAASNDGAFRRLNAKKGGYESCYPCVHCNRKFLWMKSLYRHYKDFHPEKLESMSEEEKTNIFGNKRQNRLLYDDGKTFKQFVSESGSDYSSSSGKAKSQFNSDECLLKCLYCSLVSKYTCSMRKHMKRFHSEELGSLDVNKIDIPVVDMESYGHNVISIDKRPADERLKDCPVIFQCKFCDYATQGQSNLKRHLMSIKHNLSEQQLAKMKLSSFKVFQKPKVRGVYKQRRQLASQTAMDEDETSYEGKEDEGELSPASDNGDVIKPNKPSRTEFEKLDGTTESHDTQEEIPLGESLGSLAEVSQEDPGDGVGGSKTCKETTPNGKSDVDVSAEEEPLEREAFTCICDREFTEFGTFIEHCKTHVNIKIDFLCPCCDDIFPMFDSLKRHHKKVHARSQFNATRLNSVSVSEIKYKQSKVRAFECPYCDIILSQSLLLHDHVSEHHKKQVVSIAIKTEPLESADLTSAGTGIVSGFRCGFCECVYSTIQDIVNHMQAIHPFVDKGTLGQGSSDCGSVRKSGRKRKAKYPGGFDEDEPTVITKRHKLDFKPPDPPKTSKGKKTDTMTTRGVKDRASMSEVRAVLQTDVSEDVERVSDVASKKRGFDNTDLTDDKTQTQTSEESNKSKKTEKSDKESSTSGQSDEIQEDKTVTESGDLKNINIQPVVNLGKKVEVGSLEPQEPPVIQKKKRGRKRKEDKERELKEMNATVNSNKQVVTKNYYSETTGENKCPHCNFTCKRSSALNFHINFNHMKIKEEPIDLDDVHTHKGIEGTPKGKRNSTGLGAKKVVDLTKDSVHVKRAIVTRKAGVGPKVRMIQERGDEADPHKPDDIFDDEDMEMMDDSDGDQDYKPSPAVHNDEDEDDDSDDDDDVDQLGAIQVRYKCLFCENEKFTSSRLLDGHVKNMHPENIGTYTLKECEEYVEDCTTELKPHKCAYCSKQYRSRNKVIKHVKQVHKNLIVSKVKVEPGTSFDTIKTEIRPTVQGKRKFKCSVCSFLCNTLKGLKKHTVRCHPDAMEQIFATELDMNSDMSNSYQCPYCRYKCYYKSSIRRHVRTMHPAHFRGFNADRACKIIHDADREKEKKEKVPEDGHYSCPFCGIINKWKKSIARHIKVVHPTEPYNVEIPPVQLPEIEEVKQSDTRLSVGFQKRLQCLHCPFTCKRLAFMKKHMATGHGIRDSNAQSSGEADFQYVYQRFGQGGQQQELLDYGEGEIGVHTCPYCGTTYGWKKSLHLHVKKSHSESLPVYETMDKILNVIAKTTVSEKTNNSWKKCDKCHIVLKTDLALRRHGMMKHNSLRKKRFAPKYTLPKYVTSWKQKTYRADRRYKSLVCKNCDQGFPSLLRLQAHSKIYHQDKKTDCLYDSCYGRFKWKSSHQLHMKQTHQHDQQAEVPHHQCEMCKKIFGSAAQLRSHIAESYLSKKATRKQMTFRCKECNILFATASLRDQHFSTAHIELTEMCEICGGVFPNKKQLQLHIKRHDKNPTESTIICDHCGMTMTKKSLKKHLLFKHTEKLECFCAICSGNSSKGVITCDMCNRKFCQKIYLYAHKRLHHHVKDRLYACKICHVSFASQKLRNVHLHEEHLTAREPQVEEPSTGTTMDVWATEEDRTTHVIHVGQDKGAQYLPKLSESSLTAVIKELVIISNDKSTSKPYKCLLCGRSFGKPKYIKLHIRRNHVKDDDKPYRCKVCGSGFVRLTEFRKHSRSHSGFRPYKCRICGKAFKQQANLLDHMYIHKDSKDFQCFICKRHFQQRGGMTSHILTHDTLKPFRCMFCDKGFTSRGELSRHMQKYSSQMAESKTFLCHICQTPFPHYPLLMRHIETHNPDKPFSCEACGIKFGSYMSLYNHKLKVKHFLLSEIQIDDEEVADQEPQLEKTATQAAVAALQMDLYTGESLEQGEEETIYIAQGGYVTEGDSTQGKTTIIIEPMEAEEIVQTSNKMHDNEELLSIAKQLTELSTYATEIDSAVELSTYTTENGGAVEFSVIKDEDEIMKDMLDADTDVLANFEKQTTKHRQVSDTPRRKVPETIEEILQIQQIENHVNEDDTLITEEQEPIAEAGGEIVEEHVIEDTQIDPEPTDVIETVTTTTGEMPTNVEEVAALIAQNTAGLPNGEGITAYETEDGVILVCMPDNVDSSAYEEVLNSAVQSLTGVNIETQEEVIEEQSEPVPEGGQQVDGEQLTYPEKDVDVPVIHVNINQVTDSDGRETTFMKIPVTVTDPGDNQADIEQITLYGEAGNESGVVEIENDESTFIKEELLVDNYSSIGNKFTLENGVFTYLDCKLRYEISGRIFRCLECGKYLKSKKRLKDHLKRHIPVECRENACMYCPSRFVTGNELVRHLAVHTDDRRYKCCQCNKSFRQPGHLAEHQLIHQNLRPHSCGQCFQSFRTKRQLIVHTERKHSDVSYKCDECDDVFTYKTSLIIHKGSAHSHSFRVPKRVGKGPKGDDGGEHQCHTCGMAFNTRTKLAKHMKFHDVDKPSKVKKTHMCDVCGSMYNSKEYLKEHMQRVHSDSFTIICDTCGDAFKTSRLLQRHKRVIHRLNKQNTPLVKRIHPCKICKKPFSTRHALAYHIGATPACKNAKIDPSSQDFR